MMHAANNAPRPPAGEGLGERAEASNDLDILFPNRQITVGGKTLTVREYSFKESLEHSDSFQSLIAATRALMQDDEPKCFYWLSAGRKAAFSTANKSKARARLLAI